MTNEKKNIFIPKKHTHTMPLSKAQLLARARKQARSEGKKVTKTSFSSLSECKLRAKLGMKQLSPNTKPSRGRKCEYDESKQKPKQKKCNRDSLRVTARTKDPAKALVDRAALCDKIDGCSYKEFSDKKGNKLGKCLQTNLRRDMPNALRVRKDRLEKQIQLLREEVTKIDTALAEAAAKEAHDAAAKAAAKAAALAKAAAPPAGPVPVLGNLGQM